MSLQNLDQDKLQNIVQALKVINNASLILCLLFLYKTFRDGAILFFIEVQVEKDPTFLRPNEDEAVAYLANLLKTLLDDVAEASRKAIHQFALYQPLNALDNLDWHKRGNFPSFPLQAFCKTKLRK